MVKLDMTFKGKHHILSLFEFVDKLNGPLLMKLSCFLLVTIVSSRNLVYSYISLHVSLTYKTHLISEKEYKEEKYKGMHLLMYYVLSTMGEIEGWCLVKIVPHAIQRVFSIFLHATQLELKTFLVKYSFVFCSLFYEYCFHHLNEITMSIGNLEYMAWHNKKS
ncbi:hypothetical protein ACJX0J_016926 [Zea mays]